MSGPKYSYWDVIENARLAEARRQAALSEVAYLDKRFSSAVASLEKERKDIAARVQADQALLRRPGASASLEEIRSFASQLQALLVEAQASLKQAAIFRQIEQELSNTREAARRERELIQGHKAAQEEIEKQKRGEIAARVIGRAPADLDDAERLNLTNLAKAFVDGPAARWRAIEGELRAEVQRLRARAEKRQSDSAEAAALRRELWGFTAPDAEELATKLAMVEAGDAPFDPSLRSVTAATVDRLKREADRRYAAEVLCDEFKALGYDVGEAFVTAFQNGDGTSVQSRGREPYSIEFTFDAKEDGFGCELVTEDRREDLSQAEIARRDEAAERVWCQDLALALAVAEEKKVRTRVRKRIAPGVQPVRVVASEAVKRASGRRRRNLEQMVTSTGG